MKKFRTYIAVLCTMLVAAACTNEMETETTTATDVAQLVKIGGFPAFEENAQTRAIGTPDAGKIAWAANDVVLLKIQLKNGGTAEGTPLCYVLTYDGSTWKADKSLDITLKDYRNTADITAYYAPAYQWSTSTGTLALKAGKTAGTDEYLVYNATGASLTSAINIDFSQKTREYSRLRVAAASGMTVTLTSAAFTAAGTTTALDAGAIATTADAKGNAFFYGSWTAGAALAVELKEDATTFPTVSKTVTAASVAGNSYALDGFASLATYNAAGAGTEADPYQIWNKAQLSDLATKNNAASIAENTYFKLLHDINLSGEEWTPIGTVTSGQQFKGYFDGNGHSVTGISITQDITYTGLFGYTAAGSSIKNLSVAGSITNNSTTNTSFAGGLVGYNSGTITACSSTVTVTAAGKNAQVGGLVGNNRNIITACHATGTVTATDASANAGGLVGKNNNGEILACYSTGAVTANGTTAKVGGLAGNISGGYIYACYATGEVTAVGTSANVGSLVGYTNSEIWYCLTTGSIGTADANRVLNGITVNGEITGIGTVSREDLATHCHGGDGIKNTLNTEGATGFGMLNDGLSQIKDKLGIDCPPYHYVAGDNDIPVLAPGAPL